MDRYRKTATDTRKIDAMAAAMKKRQRGLGKRGRRAAIERALVVPLTPTQREACKARGSVRPVSDKGRARG